jgi:nicotinamide mononucleotide transporter
MNLFDINHIAFTIAGYPMSYTELLGTLFGLVSVYLASRTNILTWPTGIVNEVFLFVLFFQVQLYADMFLQVYFLIVTLYGWYRWRNPAADQRITTLSLRSIGLVIAILITATFGLGYLIQHLHEWLPDWFIHPASYPYTDSFVMAASMIANFGLARKKLENWLLWIIIDIICVALYIKKGIYFLAIEYVIFTFMASYGYFNWRKQFRHD